MNSELQRLERNKQKLLDMHKPEQAFQMQRVINMVKMYTEQDPDVYKKQKL